MNTKSIRLITIILMIIISSTGISYGIKNDIPANDDVKVVMIIINRIDFNDLESMHYTKDLMDKSSIALMNTRASGSNSEFKSYATIGWGVRAEASHTTSLFYNINEENKEIYKRRTGNSLFKNGLINLDINRLIVQNQNGEYGAVPGELGSVLRQNGYKTAILGNSDIDDSRLNSAGLIAMDFNGYIDYGDIGTNCTKEDATRSFGIKTNYNFLLNKFDETYSNADLIVIETGDTTRLERYKNNLSSELYKEHKDQILNEIDNFIFNINNKLNKNTKFIITVPYPSNEAANKGDRLTPLIIYEGDQNGQVLYSDTTRRDGIVGNVDIAPTVLSYFNLNSNEMTGRILRSKDVEDNLNYLKNLNKRVVNTSTQRVRVLYSFAIYEIIASILALGLIVFRKKIQSKWYKYISLGLIGSMIAPFTLLIIPLFGATDIIITYALLISITAFVVFLIYLLSKDDPLNVILYSAALLVFSLLLDIITGQNLIKNSLLGYDPIIGARYYGIGNEYMGILIGAVLILATVLMEKYSINKYISIAFLGLVTIIVGFPKFGANVGGTITAVFTFLFVSIRLIGQKINFKKIIYIGLAVIGVVGMMAIIDLFIIESQSHLAGAINQIVSGGPVVIYQIIVRKISMNLRLIGVTIWSKVLLSAIIVLGVLFYKPIGLIKQISLKYPKIAIGWSGIIVACIIGFAVNDSGIVSAATSIIFLISTVLYLIIHDLEH